MDWLKDYLTGLTHTTVLIVSHDTPFLEDVVSDGKRERYSSGLTFSCICSFVAILI